MKNMTVAEARAALKKAMPWAKHISLREVASYGQPPWGARVYTCDIDVLGNEWKDRGGFVGYGRTLREAVRRCIAAARKVGAATNPMFDVGDDVGAEGMDKGALGVKTDTATIRTATSSPRAGTEVRSERASE